MAELLKPRIHKAAPQYGPLLWRLLVPGYIEYFDSFDSAVGGLTEWWERGNRASWIRRPGAGPDGRRDARLHILREKYGHALLTSNDPEPGHGVTVEDFYGDRWRRTDDGDHDGAANWEKTNVDYFEPESWTHVAGNGGPVRIVETGRA